METIKIIVCNYSYHLSQYDVPRREMKRYLFRLQMEGTCHALVDGQMTAIRPKDLLMYKPGDFYELHIAGDGFGPADSGDYFVICEGKWLDQWWNSKNRRQLTRLNNTDRLLPIWKELVLQKWSILGNNGELIDSLVRTLCLLIDQTAEESAPRSRREYTSIRMKDYIEMHAFEPFEIKDVADYVKLSVSRATHLFKEYYGKSMIRFATELRLDCATEKLVYGDLTLEQIALSSGFSSYTYFYRTFIKYYGVSPGNYKNSISRNYTDS